MGWGVLKVKLLEAKYEAKLEFPGGRGGCKTKKPSVGGKWIFSGSTTKCTYYVYYQKYLNPTSFI